MGNVTSYAFRSEDTSILTLDSIGWQIVSSEEYQCPSEERRDLGHVVFQYTLKGQGYLDIDDQTIPLPKGHALLVKISEKHNYYYKKEVNEAWEFIWINIRGDEANRIWKMIIEKEGSVIQRNENSPLIQELFQILHMINHEKIIDKYSLSIQVYRWLLTLIQTSQDTQRDIGVLSMTTIEKCKTFIRENYASPLTLDLIANYCNINKHYLCRLFKKSNQTTPLAYLKDRRIEAALTMLRTTELPISQIGQQCGFENPSYFGKVFRKYMSMSPKEYRIKKLAFPYDAIFYE